MRQTLVKEGWKTEGPHCTGSSREGQEISRQAVQGHPDSKGQAKIRRRLRLLLRATYASDLTRLHDATNFQVICLHFSFSYGNHNL
jgi:hypothetical protein